MPLASVEAERSCLLPEGIFDLGVLQLLFPSHFILVTALLSNSKDKIISRRSNMSFFRSVRQGKLEIFVDPEEKLIN